MPPTPDHPLSATARLANLQALLAQLLPDPASIASLPPQSVLDLCRCAFLLARDDQQAFRTGQFAITDYSHRFPASALTLAYCGAFKCIEASYLLWPLEQFHAVKHGLDDLDRSLKIDLQLENAFLMAMILDKLPPIFPERARGRALRTATSNRLAQQAQLPAWFAQEIQAFLAT